MEIRRTRDWLQRDQLSFWQSQVKWRQEAGLDGPHRTASRRLSQSNSDAISDTEQKENVRVAQRRLAEAEEKVERVKRWIPVLEHAISEYHSQSQPPGRPALGQLRELAGRARPDGQPPSRRTSRWPRPRRPGSRRRGARLPALGGGVSELARTGAAVAPPQEPAEEAPPAEPAATAPPTGRHAGVGAARGHFGNGLSGARSRGGTGIVALAESFRERGCGP